MGPSFGVEKWLGAVRASDPAVPFCGLINLFFRAVSIFAIRKLQWSGRLTLRQRHRVRIRHSLVNLLVNLLARVVKTD